MSPCRNRLTGRKRIVPIGTITQSDFDDEPERRLPDLPGELLSTSYNRRD